MGFIPLKEKAQPTKRGFIPLREEQPKRGFVPLEAEAPPIETPLPPFSFQRKDPLEKPLVSVTERTGAEAPKREIPSPYERPLPSEAPVDPRLLDTEPKPTTKLVQPRREREVDPYGAVIMKQLASGITTTIPKAGLAVGKIAARAGKALEETFITEPYGVPPKEAEKIGRIDPEKMKVDPAKYIERGIAEVEKALEPKIPEGDRYRHIAASVSKGIGELGVLYATGGFPAIVAKEGVEKTEEAQEAGASLPKSLTVGTAQALMTAIKLYMPAKIVAHPAFTSFIQRATAGAITNIPAWVTANELEMRVLDEKILGKKHTPEEFRNRFYGALFSAGFITIGQAIKLSARTKTKPGVRARVEKDVTPPPPGEPPAVPAPRQIQPPVAKPPAVPPVTPPISTIRAPVRVVDGEPPEIPPEQIAAEDAAILQEAKDQLAVVNNKLSKLRDTADDAFRARHLDRERVYLEEKVRYLTPEVPPPVDVVPEPFVTVEPPVAPEPPPEPAPPVKKLRKGQSVLKLTTSQLESLKEMKTEVEEGMAGQRVFTDDPLSSDLIVSGEASTYPEWYRNRKLKREEVLDWLDRAIKGEGLTDRMQFALNDFLNLKRAPVLEGIVEERAQPREVPAVNLDEGDTYKIYGEQFKVKEVRDDGNIVVQDGEKKVLSPDDTVIYDRGTLKQEKPAVPTEDRLDFPAPGPGTAAEAGALYRRTEEAPLIEMPEVVELAKEINEGKYPKIKENLGNKLGQLRWTGGPEGRADISLRADIFAGDLIGVERVKPKDAKVLFEIFKEDFIEKAVTPESGIREEDLIFRKDYNRKTGLVEFKVYRRNSQLAPGIMAHEVGHLVDWIPDRTLKRGNILGHIKSLKRFMIRTIDNMPTEPSQALTSKDRGKLRRQALIEIGKLPPGASATDRSIWKENVRNRYNSLIEDELGARGLISRDEVMQELKTLSQARKPFDVTTADPKYLKYRYSSKELYADAVSAFVNTPQLFKQKAPKFHRAFLGYMKNKPAVKKIYNKLTFRIFGGGREAVVDKRIDKAYNMFKEGDLSRQEMHKRNLETEEGLKDTLTRWLIDKYQAELKPIRQQEKMAGDIGKNAREARYALEEIPYLASSGEHYFYNVFDKLIRPAEARGISSQDIGFYMFANRIARERTDIANPLGYTKKDAMEMLESLPKRWGAEKYNEVVSIANQYNAMRNEFILSEVEGAGLFTPELMEHVRNNPDYAKFSVHKFLENKFGSGTTAKIYKQIGTLSEIENPFVATILQDISLLRASVINKAKQSMVNVLDVSEQITPADMRYSKDLNARVPKPPKDPKLDILTVMIDGKPQHFYTSKTIVDSFRYAPLESTKIARVWASMNDVFRSVLVSKNPLWMARNVVKDFKATMKNNPEVRLRDTIKLIKDYRSAFGEAWTDVMKGTKSKDIQDMLRERVLLSDRAYGARERTFDDELERLATEFNLSSTDITMEKVASEYNIYGEAQARYAYTRLKKLWDYLDKLGKVSERTGKVAGYKYLKNRTDLPAKELAHRVRTRIGTPDVKRQGALQQITNNIFMFSNVAKEGIRSSWESYKDDPAGYIWKTIAMNIMPKLVLAGAAVYGTVYMKKVIAGIPDYDKKHYTVIPLWLTDTGKSVYIRMPEDYQGQLFGALAWDVIHGRITGKEGAVKTLAEASPYQLHPALEVGGDLFQYYIAGNNPQDEYKGRPVIPELTYKAGGIEAHKAIAKHAWRNVGGKVIYDPGYDIEKERSTTEKILNTFPFSIAGTFIKVSDRGKAERLDRIIDDIRQHGAEVALSRQVLIKHGVNDERGFREIVEDLKDRGLLSKGVRRQLIRYRGFKADNPYVNALSAAKDKKERRALLKQYKEELSEEEYREIIRIWKRGK